MNDKEIIKIMKISYLELGYEGGDIISILNFFTICQIC